MSNDAISDDMPASSEQAQPDDLNAALSGGGDENFVVTEQKKPLNRTTLVLFLILALGGGGLYLMHLRTGPKPVDAAPAGGQTSHAVTQFLSGGSNNLKSLEQMLRNTQKIVQQFLAYPS